jgi:hypothetical protein
MPIHRLLNQGAFEPEDIATMAEVFEDVLKTLDLVDRTDPITELVAKKVIELVQSGVRDPVRLRELTLKAFNGKPPEISAA